MFGIPGNHTLELYRGLSSSSITHITTRHEQGAGFMADGYARASGQVGVCFLISGPGLLNAATAMGQALADSVPMLVVTAVAPSHSLGKGLGELHELPDQQAAARGFCKLSLQVDTPAMLIEHLALAFRLFEHQRPGPVHVQIPLDVMEQTMPGQLLARGIADARARQVEPSPVANDDWEIVQAMVTRLQQASTPILLCGGGAVSAAHQWRDVAETLQLPVMTTCNAKGLIPPDHPLAVGGSPSLACIRDALRQADVVLAVGTEFGETDYNLLMDGELVFEGALFRIDIDFEQLHRHQRPDLALCASASMAAQLFLDALAMNAHQTRRPVNAISGSDGAMFAQRLRVAALLEPHWHPQMADFFATLAQALGDTCVVGDSTRPTYYAAWQYQPVRPRRYFHSATGFGTLGYAIPAALGAAAALGEPVLALVGDGGAQFTLTELGTAVDNRLPVTLLIWCNSGYEEIENSLRGRGVDIESTRVSAPDFGLIAQAYGVPFTEPDNLAELEEALRMHSRFAGPSLVLVKQERFVTQPSGQWYG